MKPEQLNFQPSEEVIQASQASFITVFGIFASITSFLTIEFQFLKTLNNILILL